MRTARAAALVVVMATLTLSHPGRSRAADAPSTLRVVGEATINAKPDLAELDLGVVSEAPSAAAAAADNARKMDRVLTALRREVGSGGEVKTVGYMVSQRYGDPMPRGGPQAGQQAITAYVVTNIVRARTPDIAAAGRLVDGALKLGANDVQRLAFTLKDPEPVQAEALKSAAAKARARANALAAALGLRVTGVVSVSEGDTPGPVVLERSVDRAAAAMLPATPVEPGTLEVRATVSVVFAVAGR